MSMVEIVESRLYFEEKREDFFSHGKILIGSTMRIRVIRLMWSPLITHSPKLRSRVKHSTYNDSASANLSKQGLYTPYLV